MDSTYVGSELLRTPKRNGGDTLWLCLTAAFALRLLASLVVALAGGLLSTQQLQYGGLVDLGALGLIAGTVEMVRARRGAAWQALRAVLADTRFMVRLVVAATGMTFALDLLLVAGLNADVPGIALVRVFVLAVVTAAVLSRMRQAGSLHWPELTLPTKAAAVLAGALGYCLPLVARRRRPNAALGGTASIVLVAYYYPPHNEVGAARPHRFARYLRRHGTAVSVVCSNKLLRRQSDRKSLAGVDAAEHAPVRVPSSVPAAGLRRMSAILHKVQRVLMPYDDCLEWLPHAYAAASQSLTARSVLVSTHPPVVTHLVALLLKLRTGLPWVADFRDPLWGNPFRAALRASWLDPVIERLVLRFADAVIANTDAVAFVLRHRYPDAAGKVHTIWNGFDPDDVIKPLPPQRRDRLVISHIGTLYGSRTPVPFATCLQRLIHRGALRPGAVQFRQIGGTDSDCFDPQHPALLELAMLDCFYQSRHHLAQADARQEMVEADVLLLLDLNDASPGLQVPAKLFEYIRAGRPILALTIPGSATERVLALSGVPHACVDIGLPAAAFDAEVLAFLMAEHAPAVPSTQFMEQFSMAEQVKTLLAILERVSMKADHVSLALTNASAQMSVRLPSQKQAAPATASSVARHPPSPTQATMTS